MPIRFALKLILYIYIFNLFLYDQQYLISVAKKKSHFFGYHLFRVSFTASNGIYLQGSGPIRIAVLGIDSFSNAVIYSMLNATCSGSKLFEHFINNTTVHILLPYASSQHLSYLKVYLFDSIQVSRNCLFVLFISPFKLLFIINFIFERIEKFFYWKKTEKSLLFIYLCHHKFFLFH